MIPLDLAPLTSRRPSLVRRIGTGIGEFVMEVKASGRVALVIATGLWIGLSGLGVTD